MTFFNHLYSFYTSKKWLFSYSICQQASYLSVESPSNKLLYFVFDILHLKFLSLFLSVFPFSSCTFVFMFQRQYFKDVLICYYTTIRIDKDSSLCTIDNMPSPSLGKFIYYSNIMGTFWLLWNFSDRCFTSCKRNFINRGYNTL